MRVAITGLVLLLRLSAGAAASATAALTPPPTSPTPATTPTSVTSSTPTTDAAPTVPESPRPTAHWTPRPSASPSTATAVAPTPIAAPEDQDDAAATNAIPTADTAAANQPAGGVRAFRTPDRDAPPAFVAPDVPPPGSTDDAETDAAAPEPMPSPDQPYVATVTFHAVAATEIDGFELFVIYPRSAGTFVGTGTGIDCRKTGEGMLGADDQEGGTMRLLVASDHPLAFPLDIVCHFTVQPNASLTPRLIAVNVVEVSIDGERGDPGALSVSVSAR